MSLASEFVELFQRHPIENLIENITAEMTVEIVGNEAVPVSLSDRGVVRNNYFVSPTTAYIDYAREEVFLTGQKRSQVTSKIMASTISLLRPLLITAGLDHQIQLNNWMVSTCPSPANMPDAFPQLIDKLAKKYPDRAIVIRSLNRINNNAFMKSLSDLGFLHLPARKVYIHQYEVGKKLPQNVRSDRNLLKKSGLIVKQSNAFSDQDFEQAYRLYRALYVDKYTSLNPIYTPLFFKEASRLGVIKLQGLVDDNEGLIGIVGNFSQNGVDTTPIVGYDTAKPMQMGLYRMLIWLALEAAAQKGICHNLSAGADRFKMLRGGVPTIEFTSVYTNHLSAQRRAATRIIYNILTHIGIPILNAAQT